MNKTLTVLLATTAIAFAAPAIAADASYKAETKIERNDDGSFKKSVTAEQKNAAGKTATEVETEVDVENDGDRTAETTVKKINDPKGLWNKQTEKTTTTDKVVDGKVVREVEKTVNGDTVIDSKTEAGVSH